ncbi:MAG: hypothetical protein U9P79_05980 [Candidatus Cloacimonadota bacterium]|nr:hypothetical protein [Candidatus Cloacimonadota bacterium]
MEKINSFSIFHGQFISKISHGIICCQTRNQYQNFQFQEIFQEIFILSFEFNFSKNKKHCFSQVAEIQLFFSSILANHCCQLIQKQKFCNQKNNNSTKKNL